MTNIRRNWKSYRLGKLCGMMKICCNSDNKLLQSRVKFLPTGGHQPAVRGKLEFLLNPHPYPTSLQSRFESHWGIKSPTFLTFALSITDVTLLILLISGSLLNLAGIRSLSAMIIIRMGGVRTKSVLSTPRRREGVQRGESRAEHGAAPDWDCWQL